MSTTTNSTTYSPDSDAIEVREVQEGDRIYKLTAPVSSDRKARDGQSFTREKLEAFRDQLNSQDQPTPLMVDHGKSEFGGESRYSVLGRIGTVDSAELARDGDATLLRAEMSVADPDALAEEGDAGEIEAALRYLKYQAETIGLSFSVGWDEESGRTSGPEILEVSAVAVPSDVTSSTAAADPTEVAARGFEALSSRADSRDSQPLVPEFWRDDDPTDEEAAAEALDALEHVREHHTRDDDVPPWKRRDETPPVLATIDELRRLWGHDRDSVTIEERLAELVDDERQREDVLARLDEVEKYAGKLAQPTADEGAYNRPAAKVYPFGRSRDESIDRITEACETLRELLTDPDPFEGWGMAAYMEARE